MASIDVNDLSDTAVAEIKAEVQEMVKENDLAPEEEFEEVFFELLHPSQVEKEEEVPQADPNKPVLGLVISGEDSEAREEREAKEAAFKRAKKKKNRYQIIGRVLGGLFILAVGWVLFHFAGLQCEGFSDCAADCGLGNVNATGPDGVVVIPDLSCLPDNRDNTTWPRGDDDIQADCRELSWSEPSTYEETCTGCNTVRCTALDSFYFTIVTVTTIGYGDINPKKPFAMVAASTYGVVGLAAIGYILSKLSDKATSGVTNALNRLNVQAGTADPYVVLRDDRPTYCGLRSNAMYQTPALPKHLTGLFDEDMDAWIVDADDLNDEHEMEFEVWDMDRLDKDDLIGRVTVRPHAKPQIQTAEPTLHRWNLINEDPQIDVLRSKLWLRIAYNESKREYAINVVGVSNMPLMDDFRGAESLSKAWEEFNDIGIALLILTGILAVSSVIYSVIEDDWDFFTALYFSFVSMTTIGYGDFSPQTVAGRAIFVIFATLVLVTGGYVFSIVEKVTIERAANAAFSDGQLDEEAKREAAKAGLLHSATFQKYTQLVALTCVSLTAYLFGGYVMLRIEEDVFSNFREAVYWAVVTLTTIGYGDMSPATWQGQLFFIFYSMLGVAILSSFLSIIAQSAVSDAIEYAEYSSESGVEAKEPIWDHPAVHPIGIVLALLLLLFGGAAVFVQIEPTIDSYGLAIYFSVITFTTIGYGDYSPSTPASQIFFIVYIHASLAVMAESLSFLQAGSSKALGNTIKKVDGSIEELDEIAAELTMKTVPGGNAAAVVDASASVSASCSDETTTSTAALSSSVASSSAASSSASASADYTYGYSASASGSGSGSY